MKKNETLPFAGRERYAYAKTKYRVHRRRSLLSFRAGLLLSFFGFLYSIYVCAVYILPDSSFPCHRAAAVLSGQNDGGRSRSSSIRRHWTGGYKYFRSLLLIVIRIERDEISCRRRSALVATV